MLGVFVSIVYNSAKYPSIKNDELYFLMLGTTLTVLGLFIDFVCLANDMLPNPIINRKNIGNYQYGLFGYGINALTILGLSITYDLFYAIPAFFLGIGTIALAQIYKFMNNKTKEIMNGKGKNK